jgi:hypothetical protein
MDPTTTNAHFPYTIRGCSNDDQVAVNCKTSLDIALNYLSTVLPILKWSSTNNLQVFPKAGVDFNAFYDRPTIQYFYKADPLTQEVVYAANSSKVCIHELGHAALDSFRPDFWNTQCAEIWAYHEGIGDITAIDNIMRNGVVVDKALKETGGNLRQSNILTRLAEELGNAIWHARGNKDNNLNGLRNAVNDFKYTPPEELPSWAPDDQLSSECHSFGRLIVGTWWDIVMGIYEYEQAAGLNQKDALEKARSYAYITLIKATMQAPQIPRFHEGLAKIMLVMAQGGQYQNIINKVFVDRKILQPVIKALGLTSKKDVDLTNGITTIIGQTEIIVVKKPKTLKLADHITEPKHLKAMFIGGYNLSQTEIEVAGDKYYEFDQHGNLIHEIVPTDDEVIKAAQMCVTAIESIGPGSDTMWEVTNNKLLRTYICTRRKI